MKFLRFFISRWFLSFVIVLWLCLGVWYLGPYLTMLEPWLPRAAIIGGLALLWLAINLLLDWRKRRRERSLTRGLTNAAPDPTAMATAEEQAALRERLENALRLLKAARGTRGYLYEQPWYVIIGPPGAGKTTALLNAGLQFPLAAEMGQGAVKGVGGTRLCDWWFTDQAVLIDTAGRYTTQDSDAVIDRAGWEGFLDLIKRTRPRQPLNGVIVAISLADIAGANPGERAAHARAIRKRIKELGDRLAIRQPVYALFTKADLLAGFTEFFDDLDRDRRGQVWGATFPLQAGGDLGPVAGFAAELKALVARLNDRVLERLQAERSPDRRALIAGFPSQVASLEEPITAFLAEAFGGSRLDPAPMLRGAYLTSGTQEGTPIDRLTGMLARSFGLDQRRAPSLRPEAGRSYFLTRLLRDVIFNEAMLVSERPGAARRRVLRHLAGYAVALLALLAGAALIFAGGSGTRGDVMDTDQAVAAYRQAATPVATDPVTDADLPRIDPVLTMARALPHGVDSDDRGFWLWRQIGLSQAGKLAVGARQIYRQALERLLFPRLMWRLESQLRGNLERPDFLYEATRVYLMLGGKGPMDKDLVRTWMKLDWAATYPGPAAAPMRESLARHLDALLAEPLPVIDLDGAMVQAARATFSRVPLAQRVYSRIRPSAAALAVPPWRPSDALGPSGVRVFLRTDGQPLTDGVAGFFTIDGFHKVLLPALGRVAADVANESWVLGERAELRPGSPEEHQLEREVIGLYEAQYAQAWDKMLASLELVPLRNAERASEDLYVLASPQSPLRDLMTSIARQLTLSQPPGPPPGLTPAQTDQAKSASAAETQRLEAILGTPAAGDAPPRPPGSEIDDRYKAFRDYVGSGPGAPLDNALKAMNTLQTQLAKLASTVPGSAPPAPRGEDPAVALRAAADQAPEPMKHWVAAMTSSGAALRGGGAKAAAAAAFNASGGPGSLCKQAIAGRFPFAPGSAQDVPLDDFAKLFSPGGLLDSYFNTQLRPWVDTSGTTWRAQAMDGVPPPISPADLAQFQRAAQIRDLFFGAGGKDPAVRFDITPAELDSGARQVTLNLNGDEIRYAFGPLQAHQVIWPGPNRMGTVRLVFDPPATDGTVLQGTGPWALFRLFAQGALRRDSGTDRYTLTFTQGDRRAVFQIQTGSVQNPLDPALLTGFRCPAIPP